MATRKTVTRKTAPRKTATPGAAAKAKPAVARPATKATASKVTVKPGKAVKPPKLHRKPVRDSFTMPEADFALIATLKARALAGQRETKKSELLRAGLQALAALDSAGLLAALGALEPVKIGRPKKAH
jgi:hypothetical protein